MQNQNKIDVTINVVAIAIAVWGWTDARGLEIAIVGCSNGVSFVDVTYPNQPLVVGLLPTHTEDSE